jgi:hypothetical protein
VERRVFDEVRAFFLGRFWVVVVVGWRVRAAEARGGEGDWEAGEGAAEGRESGDRGVVSLQGEGGVPARDVLAEEFTADCGAWFAAESGGVPVSDDGDVGVVAWADVEVLHSGVAEESVVVQDVDVDVWNGGRVVGWVGQVYKRSDGQRRLGRIDNVQVEDFGL